MERLGNLTARAQNVNLRRWLQRRSRGGPSQTGYGMSRGGPGYEARARGVCHLPAEERQCYMKRELNQNLSGNKIYYTACSLLVILNNSCSKIHCQKGFNLILTSYIFHTADYNGFF